MEDYEKICQDIKECMESKECKKLINKAEVCIKGIKEEKERLKKIKKNLDNSYYSKIFDTAIENVKLKEENINLKLKEKEKEKNYTYHDSPNIALIIKWLSPIVIIFALYLTVSYTIDNIHEKNITEKSDQSKRENNESS